MTSLAEYMLKTSACLAITAIFYWLMLSRLTNYKSNRFYLLLTSVLAFIIPVLRLDQFVNPQTITSSGLINHIPALSFAATDEFIPAGSSVNIAAIIIAVFTGGVVVAAARFIIQLLSFKRITSKARLISSAYDVQLYHLDLDIIPFSFGRAIYLNKNKHTAAELNDIIRHESVHIHQQHTIDVVIAEIVCILNWYNPFAWLMKHAIKQNLEFLADDTVLKDGADKKSYQYLLLKVSGYSPLQMVSSFKLSSLKQRIFMMNKTRTSQRHLLKLLFVLPIVAFTMLAFRNENTTASNAAKSMQEGKFMLGWLSYNIQDANIDKLIKDAQQESLLHVGRMFDLTTIMDERNRLKSLLEKNGYSNINSHAISFMIDSTFENEQCAIEINIDLNRKTISSNNSLKQTTDNDKVAAAFVTTEK